ncbi:restriction endonuclease subunit S [Candidatus Woesearchaeota archaeon]|nr:restriction endonuclease subunit S [Candidatus Woesearchaeota archaeon]
MKQLPKGWIKRNLLECVERETSSNNLKIPQSEFLEKGKFPIIDQGDNFIAGYTDNESKVLKINRPVIIFGDHTRILKFIEFSFALGADGVKVILPKSDINPKYLFYFLKNIKIESHGYSRHYKFLKALDVVIPPISIQDRIVSILEKAEKLKQKREEADRLTQKYLQSVFYGMFGKIKPQEFDSEIFEIIDGDRGVNYPHGDDFSDEGYCLFLNTGNVRENGFNFDEVMFITKEKDGQLRKGKAKINDIILTTRGTVGNVALYSQEIPFKNVRINSGMVLLRPNLKRMNPRFLSFLIHMPIIQDQFKQANSGTAQPQLPIINLKKIKIPLPPLPLQEKFAKIVKRVENLKEKQNQSKEKIDNLFNSLMQKAFRGELA